MPRAFIVYSSKNHIPYILGILKVINKVLKRLDGLRPNVTYEYGIRKRFKVSFADE